MENKFEGKVIDRIDSGWGNVTIYFKDGSKAVSKKQTYPAQEGMMSYTDVFFELVPAPEPTWEERVQAEMDKL